MSDAAMGALFIALGALCWIVASKARELEAWLMEGFAHAWTSTDAGAARFGASMGEVAYYALKVAAIVALVAGAVLLLG